MPGANSRHSWRTPLAGRKKNVPLRKIIKKALEGIGSEMDIVRMDLEHPERFIVFPEDRQPLARWSGTMMELLEYFIPLQMAGKLFKPSGEPMTFADVIKLIESIFGVIANKPYDMKTKILSRKKNITPFIDKMRQMLLEVAEKLNQ